LTSTHGVWLTSCVLLALCAFCKDVAKVNPANFHYPLTMKIFSGESPKWAIFTSLCKKDSTFRRLSTWSFSSSSDWQIKLNSFFFIRLNKLSSTRSVTNAMESLSSTNGSTIFTMLGWRIFTKEVASFLRNYAISSFASFALLSLIPFLSNVQMLTFRLELSCLTAE